MKTKDTLGLSLPNQSEAQTQSESRAQTPHEKRASLIAAMGLFRPKSATPVQFYNFVREFCIMHNCSIDEAMERSPESWSRLSKDQRQLYSSEMHAALPIPVPRHLIYRAFQMERAGRWKISSVPAPNGGAITYSVESYAPPAKLSKMQSRIRAQYPRYDNLSKNSPCSLESPKARGPATPEEAAATAAAASAAAEVSKKVRTLTPPEQRAQQAQQDKGTCSRSLTRILSADSLKELRSGRNKVTPAASIKRINGGVSANSKQQSQHQKQQQQQQKQQQKQQQQQQQPLKLKMATKSKSKKLMTPAVVRQKQVNKNKKSTKSTKSSNSTKQAFTVLPKTEIKRKHPTKKSAKKS